MSLDHDQIFKQLIESFFREFMQLFFSAEAALIDFNLVEFLREELFTDIPDGQRRRLDLVVKVDLLGGGEKFVLIHVEFESSRPDADFPRRMYRYFSQLYLRHQTEILPVAVFTDDVLWQTPVPDFLELSLAGSTIVRFVYRQIKLKQLDHRAFLSSNNPLAYALMAKMDYNATERVRLKADFLRLILGCGVNPARQSLLAEFVGTYLPLSVPEQVEFNALLDSERQYEEVKHMVSVFATEAFEKGIEQGLHEGLILLLEKRFGPLDQAIRQRVYALESREKLDALLLAVLDSPSLAELPW